MDPSDLGQVATGLLNMAVATAPAGASQRVLGAIASKIEKVLNTSEFIKGLNKIAPPLICDGQQAPKRLRDSEFVRVSDWCAMYGKHEWSLRPRTFIILHMIGCYEAVDEFVQLGYSDIALPYTAANLPKAVKGDKARRQFLDLQNFVLTAHAEHLEKEGEPHQNVEGNADDYFITVKELGRGSFGQVDHVVGRLSIDHFARKRIPRGRSFKRDREAIKSFENELKALKTLSHRHLVKLISSYTDQNWVGLIMKPVADCNLDYFLRAEDIDQIDRQTCLRRFFGCLATAVDYLHQKQIRHKDIKPANILVKNRAVLLTDFGTSHNWSNDTRSTSSGTSIGFTKRYCAPEVAGCAARNQASDLWSLGCVFLEMGTTLNNRTVDEMRSYFETHGTRGPYVRGNSEAADMWLEELKNSSNSVDDMQPLYLSRDMCQEQPNHRPTAAQVVSEILDFQGDVPYCGHCCDSENGTLRMTNNESAREYFLESDVPQQSFQPLPFIDSPDKSLTALAGPILEENDADSVLEVFPVDCKEVDLPVVKSNWHPPTVEDYEGTVTIVYNLSSAEVIGPFESESNGDGDQIVTSLGSNLAEREMSRSPVDRFLKGLDTSRLSCQWPGCATTTSSIDSRFNGREELEEHYRSTHLVHDFGWSRMMPSVTSATRVQTQKDNKTRVDFVLMGASGKEILSSSKTSATSILETSNSASEGKAKDMASTEDAGRHVRFSMLPDSRRPEPTMPFRETQENNPNYDFINPEPLDEPNLSIGIGSQEDGEKGPTSEGLRIPRSSMVPSYFLASTNRFTRREIEMVTPSTRLSALVPPPLFVYGSLMFPSILRARAEQFTNTEGIYSERHQRRLKTDASEWSRINFSLQHAAEQMTPARLRGYNRFKPHGLKNAGIYKGDSESTVQGFVIFGLSEEALKCCDHFLSGGELEDLYGDRSSRFRGSRDNWEVFTRLSIKVDISVRGGEVMTIDAVTYSPVIIPTKVVEPWDINKFVRSDTFTKLSGTTPGSFWMEEEARLASTMGMTLVLSGDSLCSAVLQNDKDKLLELVENGHDVNAPCTRYGSVLAAAAFLGQTENVDFLIRHGANVNATGGEYHTALIAAISQGHEECAQSLIKARADVLAHGGKYISALYQAVDFGDADLAKMLLEKGAWLTKEYRELLDLAAERGNRTITRMLEDYDVRKLYLLPPPQQASGETETDTEFDVESGPVRRRAGDTIEKHRPSPSALTVIRTIGLQALYLKGQRGKWTGIKGVKILQAAFEAGVSETILDRIRPHMSAYQDIVNYLSAALVEHQEEQQSPHRKIGSAGSQGELPSSTRRGEQRPSSRGAGFRRQQYFEENSSAVADDSGDVFCLTCNGRGGRRGTGRNCHDCRGVGIVPSESSSRSSSRNNHRTMVWKCRTCNGSGLVYAERDRCRACHGGFPSARFSTRGLGSSRNRISTMPDEPPPPYSVTPSP